MAKRNTHSNGASWALTKAEDHIVIASILAVGRFVPPEDHAWARMVENYLSNGTMLSDRDLINLNNNLRRKGFAEVRLSEGHSDPHTIIRGAEKAEIRKGIRDQLARLSDADRDTVVRVKLREIAMQPERDLLQDARSAEWKSRSPSTHRPVQVTILNPARRAVSRLVPPPTEPVSLPAPCEPIEAPPATDDLTTLAAALAEKRRNQSPAVTAAEHTELHRKVSQMQAEIDKLKQVVRVILNAHTMLTCD